VSDPRQPYDARGAEEAALAREPRVPDRRRQFPIVLALRFLAFGGALAAFVVLAVQTVGNEFPDDAIPLGLPYLVTAAAEAGVASILLPFVWESPFRKLGWKVSRTVIFVVAAGIFLPIGAACVVQLDGLVTLVAGRP
jgi:hypothetical protein